MDQPRSRSPSPETSPSLACPPLDRELSTQSSFTSLSNASSTNTNPSTNPQDVLAAKRRGYMRPQATVFADSARNRDSVMCLGSIAHLQYYFARTGLLDGKGAQLAREEDQKQQKIRPGMEKRSVSAVHRPHIMQKPVQPKPRAASDIYNMPTAIPHRPIPRPIPRPVALPKPEPIKIVDAPKPAVQPVSKPMEPPRAKTPVQQTFIQPAKIPEPPSTPKRPIQQPKSSSPQSIVIQGKQAIVDPENYDPFNYEQYSLTTVKDVKMSPSGQSTYEYEPPEQSQPAPQSVSQPEPQVEPALQEPLEQISSTIEVPLQEAPAVDIVVESSPVAEAEVVPVQEEVAELPVSEHSPQHDPIDSLYEDDARTETQSEFGSQLGLEVPSSQSDPLQSDTASDIFTPALSPSESNSEIFWEDETNPALCLPPTVSTYKQKSTYVPPPPSLAVLRRELREAVEDAQRLFKDLDLEDASHTGERSVESSPAPVPASPSTGSWHQAQGLQVLDLSTLAIRAAKNYYTAHERPQRLYAIRSERMIRMELYTVLEVLKKMAMRNFAGGVRRSEIRAIEKWMKSVSDLVDKDEAKENEEHERRQKCTWLDGDWAGKERDREWLFLRSYDLSSEPLPNWTVQPSPTTPSEFLKSLQTGLKLVQLHNELVKNSARHFEEIKNFHTDTAKPYRCAENLRFWIKAAELRWDVLLTVDVMGVVNGKPEAWSGFDEAILRWSKRVREQIVKEWKEHRETQSMEKPILRMVNEDTGYTWAWKDTTVEAESSSS